MGYSLYLEQNNRRSSCAGLTWLDPRIHASAGAVGRPGIADIVVAGEDENAGDAQYLQGMRVRLNL
jgi:hypothetical protein